MRQSAGTRSIVVMGVSGSGKSTIGRLLADSLKLPFSDGDTLHSPENIATMAAGNALTDSDRLPWLNSVGLILKDFDEAGVGSVVACSALKVSYRDIIRSYVPDVFFVFLDGPSEIVQDRILARSHEFMPASLLASQFANLEPLIETERGLKIDIKSSPAEIVDQITSTVEFS
jgi:gluconokinase